MPSERRTEPPTPRRLARARREGDHPIAPSLTALSGLLAAAVFLPLSVRALLSEARELLGLALRPNVVLAPSELALRVLALVVPLLAAIAAGALALGLWQTGGAVSLGRPSLRWQLDGPLSMLRRSRSAGGVASTGIVLAALVVLGWVAVTSLRAAGAALAHSMGDVDAAARVASGLAHRLLWYALAIGVAVAALEKLVRYRAWLERHRMTREEVAREQREQEGDPALRQARRRTHLELSDGADLARIPAAAIVLLDWPRLAVALSYQADGDRPPVVLLQATGGLVYQVRTRAELHGVPIRDDAELAQSLAPVPQDSPIPKSAYAAVAAALRAARAPSGGRAV